MSYGQDEGASLDLSKILKEASTKHDWPKQDRESLHNLSELGQELQKFHKKDT